MLRGCLRLGPRAGDGWVEAKTDSLIGLPSQLRECLCNESA